MKLSRRALLAGALGAPAALARSQERVFDEYFLEILAGFRRSARRTSSSFAVCDFEDGTILPGSVARSHKTYDSVTRMMPALAAWVAGGRSSRTPELEADLQAMFRNAFDPEHPDFWLPAPADRSNQRQVESSVVAWALWLLRDTLLPGMTSRERSNIQAWLASCTQVPVRRNNWAWFTAVNQAVRLKLAGEWKEFSGDAAWMLADLEALDKLAAPGGGWYTDAPGEQVYDYYNFWVFASHYLYWNRVIGSRYPDQSRRFGERLRAFLLRTPYFFGANGAHVLYGRSLIYRWAVLTPLVLAYEQGMWPHPPGLLRRIVRLSLEYHWDLGAFDRERGKLRETYSDEGSHDICDSYIDNGHPYWCMQAFAFFLIPPRDPFWRSREEPLPAERGEFDQRFDALGMRLAGSAGGQVRWVQSRAARGGAEYRDGYTKFAYSSHFPFSILKSKERAAWDSSLVFRDPQSSRMAARAGVTRGELTDFGVATDWWAELDGRRITVTTRIDWHGDFERRTHTVRVPAGPLLEAVEGSAALGLGRIEEHVEEHDRGWLSSRSQSSGSAVVTWNRKGWKSLEVARWFEETWRRNVNAVYPRMAVNTLRAPLGEGEWVLESLHYASPHPPPTAEILARAARIA